MTTSDNLRVGRLGQKAANRTFMATESMDLSSGSHVPDTSDSISTAGNENVERRMKRQTKDTAQMPMVMANDLIGFQIPTFYHLVFASRKEVRVPGREGETSDGGDMASQR